MPIRSAVRRLYRRFFPKPVTEWDIRVQRDARLTELLFQKKLSPRSSCIDIGANKGDILERFVSLAPQGRHLAFEPIPAHAAALRKRFPDVEVLSSALSDHEGSAVFYHVPNRDAWSGLQKQQYPDGAEPVEISVDLRRLDDIVGSERKVDFIKIDVEGAEHEVLMGGISLIKRSRPTILFEHAKLHNENYGTTPVMIFELLVSTCGMTIYDLALSKAFSEEEFISIYDSSYASNYNRDAQTNFVAVYE